MSFAVPAEAYDRYMGRYSRLLAPRFADFAGVAAGQRVLDVGCGPGALTSELGRRVDPDAISAVDPSETFVAAARERHPGADVHQAAAEHLPFEAGTFDAALAQLVVHFMADPGAGLREMGRVTRDGGVVAACVWDHEGGHGPLSPFWEAALQLEPDIETESGGVGAGQGQLRQLLAEAGLRDVEETTLSVGVEHPSFEEWWDPFTLGVGPAGDYVAALDVTRRAELRERCRRTLPTAPFVLRARVWASRGLV
jgi:ubiquinone/menaquinone biosynthesis C-methylase UbiE